MGCAGAPRLVTGDDELGRDTRFRQALRERGERYVLGVPCTTMMRDLEAPSPAYSGRGRRPKAPWQSVTDWRKSLDPTAWTCLTVRDGEKGPVAIEMVKRRVQTRIERKRLGPEEWLVAPGVRARTTGRWSPAPRGMPLSRTPATAIITVVINR